MRRKPPAAEGGPAQAEWANRPERGNRLVMRLMAWISLHLGRPVARVIVYGIAAYFLSSSPVSRRSSRDYLRRALGRAPGWGDLFRHFLDFSSTIHDRLYLLNDRFGEFEIAVRGEDLIAEAVAEGQGMLLMGAHMGSFEVIRAIGCHQPGLRIAMLMYEENARKLNTMLASLNPKAQQDVIPLGQVGSMLKVRDRLEEGILVGMLGDRSLGGEPTLPVSFLGGQAALPVGPFRLAALLRRPVVFMVGLYLGGNRYEIHFEPLADFSQTPPEEREAAMAAAMVCYAALLERYCRSAPYNWFNFFDFWAEPQMPGAAGED